MALLYFMLFVELFMVSADVCIPTEHRIINNEETYTDLHRITFSVANTTYFRTLVIDKNHQRLIAGARDNIFFLNETTLEVLQTFSWESDDHDIQRCLKEKPSNPSVCRNYIQFLSIYNDKLLVCGTNSLFPKRWVVRLNSPAVVDSVNSDFKECASPYPDHPTVGSLTNLGEIIAAVNNDDSDNDLEVFTRYLLAQQTVYHQPLTTAINKKIFLNPTFAASIYVNDSVYMFYNEEAEELNYARIPTVARFCQTDNGGAEYMEGKMWTTFRKVRLNCVVKGKEDFQFTNLVSVTYNEENELFYVGYTMSRFGLLSSAICTYKIDQIEESLTSDFLAQHNGKWKRKFNGGFLKGCQVNRANLTLPISPTSFGKEPTDSLSIDALTLASGNRLMSKTVYSNQHIFQWMLPAMRFTQIVTENLLIKPATKVTVVYAATESGSIYIIYKIPKTEKVCIVEEIKTDAGIIRKLLLNNDTRLLYVGSDTKLISINTDSCDRYLTKSECIDAHSPLCGWHDQLKTCMSTATNQNATLTQDLSKCAQRKSYLSSWTKWKACKQEFDNRYCLCRERTCLSCNKSLCGDQVPIQFTNCTVNAVSNIASWLIEGPIDGSWSGWEDWSDCSVGTCGTKMITRTRSCSSPEPRNGGSNCTGDSFQCKSCEKEPEPCFIHWSGWSMWSSCEQKSSEIYQQMRNRTCSRFSGCEGETTETRHCAPEGIIWGNWTKCSQVYHIQHRYPIFITGCNNTCEQSQRPEYRICKPDPVPKTEPPSVIIPMSGRLTTESNNIPIVTSQTPIYKVIPNQSQKEKGINIKLRDLIITILGIFLTCFLVCTCIIVIILKQKKGKFSFPQEEELKSPTLYRNKSIGNGIDALLPEEDTNLPLMTNSTKV